MNYSFYCIGPDDVLRLRDEHSFLERQLAEIIVLAAANRAKDCGASWELFTSELQRHMQYEENLFFSRLRQNRGCRAAAQRAVSCGA